MTSEFASIAARVREFIASSADAPSPVGCYENDFNVLALELFGRQFNANVAYRKLCESRQATPQTVAHWTQIPAAPTAAFKDFDLTCLPPTHRTHVFHSSGTTAHRPSRHFHNAESLAVYETSLWPWFRKHVLADLQSSQAGNWALTVLAPPAAEAPNSSLVHMLEVVRRELGGAEGAFVGRVDALGAWSLDFDAASKALRTACDSKTPLVLLGTAFSFVHLLDDLAERGLRFQLPAGSRVMETGGYKGRSRELTKVQLHALITKLIGISPAHIVCEYGMSELSSQAYDKAVQSGSGILPHPCPLPKERENGSQPGSETSTTRDIEARTLLSSLPGGEGYGETSPNSSRFEPLNLVDSRSTASQTSSRKDGDAGGTRPYQVQTEAQEEGKVAVGISIPPPASRCFHFPPWARVQIISPETGLEVGEGETGLLRVFDLANVYSVLAIQTEDLAARRGDGFELLGRTTNVEPRGCSLMTA